MSNDGLISKKKQRGSAEGVQIGLYRENSTHLHYDNNESIISDNNNKNNNNNNNNNKNKNNNNNNNNNNIHHPYHIFPSGADRNLFFIEGSILNEKPKLENPLQFDIDNQITNKDVQLVVYVYDENVK